MCALAPSRFNPLQTNPKSLRDYTTPAWTQNRWKSTDRWHGSTAKTTTRKFSDGIPLEGHSIPRPRRVQVENLAPWLSDEHWMSPWVWSSGSSSWPRHLHAFYRGGGIENFRTSFKHLSRGGTLYRFQQTIPAQPVTHPVPCI